MLQMTRRAELMMLEQMMVECAGPTSNGDACVQCSEG